MEKVIFTTEDGTQQEFYIVEQTTIAGQSYLLVTDQAEGDSEAWILKDTSSAEAAQASYEMVVDDDELDAVGAVFAQMLEDIDLA